MPQAEQSEFALLYTNAKCILLVSPEITYEYSGIELTILINVFLSIIS